MQQYQDIIFKMQTALKQQKYKKIAGGIGVITACALLLYEKYKIKKFLSGLIDTSVLDADKKRPDYIYIKYHIYRESMRKMKLKQEEDKNWINIIIHPFGKWWKTFKHSVAWRLLNIAQNGDKHERLKAIRQLSLINHLKDWDFRHLAQICDARTAISLARSNCDRRWFIPVFKHGIIKNPKILLSEILNILDNLLPNKCIENILTRDFHTNLTHVKDSADLDEMFNVDSYITTKDVDLLKECIVILNHITEDINVGKKILDQGGLTTFVELQKFFAKDNETLATICKVLSNIALVENSEYHFFVTGWVGILAQWQTHQDVRLQVISSKVLANLDRDDRFPSQYPPNVYALYPRSRQRTKPKLDIVFIHGLLGGVFYTWRQKDRESPNELGLYGKNAFYTSESDDVFLVGETKRGLLRKSIDNIENNRNKNDYDNNKNYKNNGLMNPNDIQQESITTTEAPIINKRRKIKSKSSEISDRATKELVETLETSAELDSDWEVVFPDCPLQSDVAENENLYSISGDQWINDDDTEEYTNCWPMDWLPEDHPNIRILGIDYTSTVTQWSANYAKACPCEKGQGTLENRSTLLLKKLSQTEVGDNRPIVWVGHSMGGLLCKMIIMKALHSHDQKIHNLAKNSRGVIFLGTPHKGSPIARWKQHMQYILSPSIEVKELQENAPNLLRLHDNFMKELKTTLKNIKIVSIAEGSPTMLTTFKFPLTIVNEKSAYINYGDFYILKDDHLSLSKPIFRQSFLYQKILKVINDSLKDNSINNNNDDDDDDINNKFNKNEMNDNDNEQHHDDEDYIKKFIKILSKWKILNTLPEYLHKFLV